MAYTIKNTDGTTLLLLGDGKIDTNSTSLTLVGKNYSSYGEIWNNNLVKLMGNFSNATAPVAPIQGQLWYDSFQQKLNVYDEGWEPLNGAQVSSTAPVFLSEGDLWWDSSNDQMYIRHEDANKLVGPLFSKTIGDNGWALPANTVQDNSNGATGNFKQVTLMRNYGTALGLLANEQFFIATTSTNAYITNYTTSTVRGLTVLGDIKATNVLYTNTLTVTSSIVYPASERVSKVVDLDVAVQIGNLAFRVKNQGTPTPYLPQVGTVSGTASVLWSGALTTGTNIPARSIGVSSPSTLSNINTSPTSLATPFFMANVGDTLQMVVSDRTDSSAAGIKTYRVVIHLTAGASSVLACITAERLI